MKIASRLVASLLVSAPVLLAAESAFAQAEPCGNFDFFGDAEITCKIEVKGGCAANCTPLKLEAGCTGQCTATASTTCTASCGTQCIAQCDPAALDCFVGCHDECDEPQKQECLAKNPEENCVDIAVAQCDIHCRESCEVQPSNCEEHCNSCCSGGCTTLANYDCDFDCFAKLSGGCEVQCEEPSGALFCNGQYISAADVEACITFLQEQGVTVDVSARGEVTCDLNGCDGTGSAGICSTANPGLGASGPAGLGFVLAGLGAGLFGRRRRRGA